MNRLALLVFACAGTVRAAEISGRIFDPSGAVVPKASMTVTNAAAAFKTTAISGDDGSFHVPSLIAGTYEVRIGVPGFAWFIRGGLKLDTNTKLSLNPTLRIGEIVETLDIEAPGKARPPAVRPQRIRVGGNVQPARLLNQVKPEYPEPARSEGRQGTVLMRAVVSVEGKILGPRLLGNADPDLAAAAQEAVKQWRYEPTRLNGVPVETVTVVEVRFRLAE